VARDYVECTSTEVERMADWSDGKLLCMFSVLFVTIIVCIIGFSPAPQGKNYGNYSIGPSRGEIILHDGFRNTAPVLLALSIPTLYFIYVEFRGGRKNEKI
jgi:hypothetical protein